MIQEGGKRKVSRKSKKSRSKKSMKGGSPALVNAPVQPVQTGGRRRKSKKSKKSMKGGAEVSPAQSGGSPVQAGASPVQAGGRRRKSKASRKSKKSMKGGAEVQEGASLAQAGGKRKSKASRKSKTSRRSKASKKSKKSKKSRRAANPQITVRGALVKYVWNNLDVKKVAADKGMAPIGLPAKIVQMVMVEAMKDHPMSETNKKSESFWNGVQKSAMKLLADNLQKYAGMVKK